MTPVQLSIPVTAAKKSANEQTGDRIVDYVTRHPRTSKNQLDQAAGVDGDLKASKSKVRDVLRGLIDSGTVEVHPVTEAERQRHDIPKQVKEVLKAKSAVKPAEPADDEIALAGYKALVEEP
jgi:hypothetical protein